ncbi:MAG: multifunctional oxoglutarate decarboxylase/oxoglutarate dehydrogenase thiamine pyrophosphate-binding subunit/dihydrolipoyllysine-residue succinyltransferase subunit [Bryobacterales bacterium]|nr:multifunctional oxoglutarate decarboxylase/oxoglutarate dehydrogenase thiamine pyrophosphate-binding subunit/dihydrolipoyllysine-residue succinyltransferase subunit [Bryobacterales bacterium]
MSFQTSGNTGINAWLEAELKEQFRHDRREVDDDWRTFFESLSPGLPAAAPSTERDARAADLPVDLRPGDEAVPLRGASARVVDNMTASLAIPVATSQRIIPVKVVDENRRTINLHRGLQGAAKVSYTHLITWGILKAIQAFPVLNAAFAETDKGPVRIQRGSINIGIAVDLAGKGGARSLVVPNLKNAGELDFLQFLTAYDALIARARAGQLTVQDFQGTTISLTNPGTLGTAGSVPRLMVGQGAIIATGAIDYPAEYRGASPEVTATLGIGKVMTVSCTYDHRIIQGAESGMFLAKVQSLLEGEDDFYEHIFADLKMPHRPVRWEPDRAVMVPGAAGSTAEIAKEAAVLQLINAYRVRGHLIADLDPLGAEPSYHAELEPATYGLTIWDLDREFLTGSLGEAIGEGAPQPLATLRQILETLRQTYCGKIGCEYMNIQHPEQKRWLQHRMEPEANNWPLERPVRLRVLEELIDAEEFEHFLHARFVGQKRFSLEGAETAIAILSQLLDRAADQGVEEAVIGMAHRGRLNVLVNVVGKPLAQIFTEFEGDPDPASTLGSGDVKYHLGATGTHVSPAGGEVAVSVAPNPSHLEAVNPVVEGIVRPKQDRRGDTERKKVIPVLVHGDAAFAGQGVVAETLNLSQLEGYRTGGTIHLIINNQIGFTTLSEEARSSPYSTDVARTVQAPILHVNGDDPEAAVRAVQIAFDYRQRFNKDVVIDMFCYRRHGHNEADDPSYTQPILYRRIKDHPPVAELYSSRLVREGLLTDEDVRAMRERATGRLEDAFQAARTKAERFEGQDLGPVPVEESPAWCPRTAVERAVLARIADALTAFPEGFHLHPKLRAFTGRRREAFDAGGPIDWAFGEAMAFGSLVLEGTPVRLSGQDSGRGTFSQRHLEFFDYQTGIPYTPLQHLAPDQARFQVFDSALSEYAVMGFEFGYSVADPLTLVLWEAQFGDFANGAQIMIDQFVSCAESKWGQPSGLVLLLPHGFEGQGPEHSSARIERFLVLCAGRNMQVVNCTTPAQYFHVLRRQMCGGPDRRGVRKPLVIFTPKSLLRHPGAVSRLEEFSTGGFREVIDDGSVPASAVGKVVFCCGKVYYDLLAAREERRTDSVALVRVEQLYPFPEQDLLDVLEKYPQSSELVWAQEEPRNMGAWRYMRDRLRPLIASGGRNLRYAGRPESASPATGSHKRHALEQAALVEEAFAPPFHAAKPALRLAPRAPGASRTG